VSRTSEVRERMSELEQRARGFFRAALKDAVESTFEEAKRLELTQLQLQRLAGIARRALDAERARWGWD
jgi:hypothetical protein